MRGVFFSTKRGVFSYSPPKCGSPIPNSRGHTEAWESVSPIPGATLKRGSPYPQLEGPQKICAFEIYGPNPAFEMGLPEKPKTPPHKPPILTKKPKNPPPKNGTKKPPHLFYQKKPHCLPPPKKTLPYQKNTQTLPKKSPVLTKKTPFFFTQKNNPKPYRGVFWYKNGANGAGYWYRLGVFW